MWGEDVIHKINNVATVFSATLQDFQVSPSRENVCNELFEPHKCTYLKKYQPFGKQRTVAKEGGQGRYCTDFGIGSGSGSESGVFPYPDLPAPRAIFSIFFNYFHIFSVITFFIFSRYFFFSIFNLLFLVNLLPVLSKPATSALTCH